MRASARVWVTAKKGMGYITAAAVGHRRRLGRHLQSTTGDQQLGAGVEWGRVRRKATLLECNNRPPILVSLALPCTACESGGLPDSHDKDPEFQSSTALRHSRLKF